MERDTKPVKQHIYAFHRYQPGLKPHHRISYDVFKRFKTLSIVNYSVIQMFALAAGEGQPVPEDQISIESGRMDTLRARYCYQIVIDRRDSDNLYRLLLWSIHGRFPGYEVSFKYRQGRRYLVISDQHGKLPEAVN